MWKMVEHRGLEPTTNKFKICGATDYTNAQL